MAWAEILKMAKGYAQYRVYLNDGCVSEDHTKAMVIIAKLKPVLDLITPTQNTHRDWVYWIITEDEYESLMGEVKE